MGNPTFLDSVREFIGGIAWDVYLWANRWTVEEYRTLIRLDALSELPQVCAHGYNGICAICDATMTPPKT